MVLLSLGLMKWSIGTTLATIDRERDAVPELEQGIAVLQRVAALEPRDERTASLVVTVVGAYAQVQSVLGQHGQAIAKLQSLIDDYALREARGTATPRLRYDAGWYRLLLGDAYWRNRERSSACSAWSVGLERLNKFRAAGGLIQMDVNEVLPKFEKRTAVCAGKLPATELAKL
jgi:hypothetical protein